VKPAQVKPAQVKPAQVKPGPKETPAPAQAQEPVELISDLYTNSTVFQFYTGSMDKPAPGAGAGVTAAAVATAPPVAATELIAFKRTI
jgi:hypothetical protein